MIFLSKEYSLASLENRILFLLDIFYALKKEQLHFVLLKTLKSLLIIKSVHFLNEEEQGIDFNLFNDWIMQFKEELNFQEISSNNFDLKDIVNIIKDSESQREKEIKTCHIFFGIMKSLRINVEDLQFQNNS